MARKENKAETNRDSDRRGKKREENQSRKRLGKNRWKVVELGGGRGRIER